MEKEKSVKSDLSYKDELSMVVANLCQIEEHMMMTIAETKNRKLIPVLDEMRKLRGKYQKEFIEDNEMPSQSWCFLKHLFSIAYRLMEVGVKNISLGMDEKAIDNFTDSREIFQLIFLLTEWSDNNGTDRQP